jgi:hypothetical protein
LISGEHAVFEKLFVARTDNAIIHVQPDDFSTSDSLVSSPRHWRRSHGLVKRLGVGFHISNDPKNALVLS